MKRKNDQSEPLPPAKKTKASNSNPKQGVTLDVRRVAATLDDCWNYLENNQRFTLEPSLQKLMLDGDVFDLKQAAILEGAIASTSSLHEVTFDGAYLGPKGIPGIIKGLRNQLYLHTLNLDGNNLRDEGAKLVFEFVKGNKILTTLKLGENGLTLNDDWILEPIVTSSLKLLYLHDNNINEGEAYLAKALAASTTLEELYLGNNKFESAVMISGALATNKSLKVLSLWNIKLLDFGAKHLVTSLLQNDSLVGINLESTSIGYDGIIALMSVVKTKKNLRFIRIAANPVARSVIDSFHDVLTQRRELQELNGGISEEIIALDNRLAENWMDSEESEPVTNDIEEIDKDQATNNNQLVEPKVEKATDNDSVDYTELEVFKLDDWWDRAEAINFVEKHPEISVNVVLDRQFGLHDTNVLYDSFYKAIDQSLKKLDERVQSACDHTKELLGPIEHMQQMRRNLELERTLLNQKIEKLDRDFKKKAEALLYQEVTAVKLSDRRTEALKNFENTKRLRSTNYEAFENWQKKMKQDISTWEVNDVVTFLEEIEVWDCGPIFEENRINGAMLANLTTEELMRDLKLTFHNAKRVQLFILMVKSGKDIYGKLPPVLDWENDQVCRWLNESNFAAHEEAFKKCEITGVELFLLDKSDLANTLQITALSERSKLIQAIEALRRERNPFGASIASAMKVTSTEPVVDENRREPPSVLICPITKKLMTDPVQANDGHTYERSAIEEWFKTSKLSPVTNKSMRSVKVVPSHALKAMLDEYNKGK